MMGKESSGGGRQRDKGPRVGRKLLVFLHGRKRDIGTDQGTVCTKRGEKSSGAGWNG